MSDYGVSLVFFPLQENIVYIINGLKMYTIVGCINWQLLRDFPGKGTPELVWRLLMY